MVPVSFCCGDAVDALTLGVAPAAASLAAAGELLGVCAADAVFSGSKGWAWPDGVWSDELGDMPNVALVLGDALEADSEDAFAFRDFSLRRSHRIRSLPGLIRGAAAGAQ